MPKLRLKVTHTHAGKAYPAGYLIEVDAHTARWLIERDIGIPAGNDPTSVADRAESTKARTAQTNKE